VSEQILNGALAQLDYTIQCHLRWMLWKIQDSKRIKKTDNTQNYVQLCKSKQHKI